MSRTLSSLPPGSQFKLNEYGIPTKFMFLEYNHYGQGESVVIRTWTLPPIQWSGSTTYNYSDTYPSSDIDTFCNVIYPISLDPVIQACLMPVPIVYTAWKGGIATTATIHRKGFALSAHEAGNTRGCGWDRALVFPEGTVFTYFITQANRVAHSEFESYGQWSLRSPHGGANDDRQYVHFIDYGGGVSMSVYAKVYMPVHNPRPALALRSDIMMSDYPDGEGCYTVVGAPAGESYQKVNGVWLRMV